MREVIGARAGMVSRVIDDEWLEVMVVEGEASDGIVEGLRWRRSDLESLLAGAEQLGRLRVTKRRTVSYAEVPDSVPETERYIGHHLGLLIAPLLGGGDDLVGVLTTEGAVDVEHPEPGVCELVELYAEQARLAMGALRDRSQMTERLRLSHAAHAVLHEATRSDDLTALLEGVAERVGDMLRASAVWVCAALEPGVHTEAAAYPAGLTDKLGEDVSTLLDPMLATSLRDGRAVTQETEPVLGRLAGVAGLEQALLAPIGDGVDSGGAMMVLRAADEGAWTADERDAVFSLARRLGTLTDQARERRRDQETLAQLVLLDESRRDLVASITHDLKTPLTAIALNTELLESDGRLAEAGSHPVTAIRRSAERLSNLVDDLLAMARAEEGVGSRVETDLVELVREACAHTETEATLRKVTFEIDAPETLWVEVDANALARVFGNLVANAVKFSLPRGRVRLGVRRQGGGVEFRCTDEGIGIPAERLDTLFDLARRAPDARTQEIPGSGIGLAICARIVDRLGGRIGVESEPGEGSTFTVTLPL
ncbi:MAG: HAMP domain-containing sensor histidine kinase [Nocardioides sp.]